MIQTILTSPAFDSTLRNKSAPVAFHPARADDLKARIQDLRDTLEATTGVGLAAIQIGVPLRIIAVRFPGPDIQVFINPVIKSASPTKQVHTEGCLSVPGRKVVVTRPRRIDMEWQDVEGYSHSATFKGTMAVILGHEQDHLNGVLIIDKE